MRELPEIIENTGAGFDSGMPGRTAKLIKRTGDVAMYKRDDGYYEVGTVRKQYAHEENIGGRKVVFEEKELYWRPEDFGRIAKTTKNEKRALELFDYFVSRKNPIAENRNKSIN